MNTQQESFINDTGAVSEVIGEVLMTAIAVLAFSVVAVFVFSYAGPQEKVHADIEGWVNADSDTIYFRHAGGEIIEISKTSMILNINGTRRELSPTELGSIKGNNVWQLGELISINTSSVWGDGINESDYIAATLLNTNSKLVIRNGALLGVDNGVINSSSGGNVTPPVTPPSGPSAPMDYIARWSMNENTGIVAYDSVGGHDGSISGASWTTGINGSALELDGSNDYVQVNERIVSDYPFSISVWLKTNAAISDQAVVNLADSNSGSSYCGLYLRSNGRVRLIAWRTNRVIEGTDINDGQWHHVVGVFTSLNDRTLYVDGIINGTDTRGSGFNSNADRWNFGRWGDSTPSAYFDGTIDEVKLWDRALNSTEVELLYLNP